MNVGNFDSWDVLDGSEEIDVFVSDDDQRTSSKSESLVSELANSWSKVFGFSDSVDIIHGTDFLEESKGVLGLFDSFDFIIDNEGNLRSILDLVTSGFNEGSNSGGSEG